MTALQQRIIRLIRFSEWMTEGC